MLTFFPVSPIMRKPWTLTRPRLSNPNAERTSIVANNEPTRAFAQSQTANAIAKRAKRAALRDAGLTSRGTAPQCILPGTPLADRLWPFVDKTGDCWAWTGCHDNNGYGQVKTDEGLLRTHVLAWRLTHGDIPEGIEVCHNCPGGDNPGCCNPAHLFLGTHAQNIQDAVDKERYPKGSEHHAAKLTETDVLLIRELAHDGMTYKAIAGRFHLDPSAVSLIVRRVRWRHD